MTVYNPSSTIISESLDILEIISQWLQRHETQGSQYLPVLIGGWAVHAYNPWFGSLDIDLITSSRIRQSLKHYLKKEHSFSDYRLPYATTGSTVKKISSEGQPIIIDFGTYESNQQFEGTDKILSFEILIENSEIRQIGNISFRIPNRSVLLILKLKASWDRHYRISHNISHDNEWEQGKLLKDYGDILALIDPHMGGQEIRFDILGEFLSEYSFLKDCLLRLMNTNNPFTFYNRISYQDGRKVIQTLLEMTE